MDLEHKFCRFDAEVTVTEGTRIEGYASLFGACDQGGDIVTTGAYDASLQRLAAEGRAVKMLWQHDPREPIGIWEEGHAGQFHLELESISAYLGGAPQLSETSFLDTKNEDFIRENFKNFSKLVTSEKI